ncbi:hypothetical protein [Streptomyces radiopugnans]|uniref:hypothetical protein n=1 Tax=Streptomyces radiopugnans TaxID=403935 RepID=UPI003F1CABB6
MGEVVGVGGGGGGLLDAPVHPVRDLRSALDLPEHVPVVDCDARRLDSSRDVLLTLMHHLYDSATATREFL